MTWQLADFWSGTRNGDLRCDLCPFRCRFESDGIGRCLVRRRRGDVLETSTMALPLRHRQPIERKPLYHFRPGATTLTMAAPGCNFRCDYCQNASFAHAGGDEAERLGLVSRSLADDVEAAANEGLVLAVSFTEPTLAAEATLALHQLGAGRAPIVWKTNGFIAEPALERLAPALAAVNIDLKAADAETHLGLTQAPLAPVRRAMRVFSAAGVWVEVSTTLIAGVNDSTDAITRMADMVGEIGVETPWHLRRFHPDHARQESAPTSPETLRHAVDIATKRGLRFVYVERALGARGCATVCPGCGAELVTRAFGRLREDRLPGGRCPGCGRGVPGRWNG